MTELKIILKCSAIGRPQNQRATVKVLDLGKMNSTITKPANEVIRGMVNTVSHLVDAEEV